MTDRPMTCAEYVKSRGFRTIPEVTAISGVQVRTLQNWHRSNNWLFRAVVDTAAREIARQPVDAARSEVIDIDGELGVIIPDDMIAALGIAEGDMLDIRVEDDCIVVEKVSDVPD